MPGATPATGTIGIGRPVPAPSLSLTNLAAAPVVIAPAPDGTGATSTATFTLGAAATVTAQVLDANGARALSVPPERRTAGPNSFTWSAAALPDGRYLLAVTAKAGTKSVTKTAAVTVDRTLSGLTPGPGGPLAERRRSRRLDDVLVQPRGRTCPCGSTSSRRASSSLRRSRASSPRARTRSPGTARRTARRFPTAGTSRCSRSPTRSATCGSRCPSRSTRARRRSRSSIRTC